MEVFSGNHLFFCGINGEDHMCINTKAQQKMWLHKSSLLRILLPKQRKWHSTVLEWLNRSERWFELFMLIKPKRVFEFSSACWLNKYFEYSISISQRNNIQFKISVKYSFAF